MTQIPQPGTITNILGIPADLRAMYRWILWKPVVRGNKLTKVPVNYAEAHHPEIDAQNELYWTDFDTAVAEMKKDPRYGIGLVLRGSGMICIDYDDHAGDDPEAVRLGGEVLAELLSTHPTYAEYSISGKGRHLFYHGVLPWERTTGAIEPLNWEIYSQQFIAITGNQVIGSYPGVAPGQHIIDSWRIPEPVFGAPTVGPTVALGRAMNLTDAEVVQTLMLRRNHSFKLLSSSADFSPKRGKCWLDIVGDLDKITGDPAQIDRIIRKSPAYKNGFNAERYDEQRKWLAKQGCETMLDYWLKHARGSNDQPAIQLAEIITPERKAFLDYILADISKRAIVAREEVLATAVKDVDLVHEVKGDDPIAQLHFLLEDNIPGEYDRLTRPPGVAGDFVDALGAMLTGARLTYMLPAVISTMAGYLGQTFKTPGFEMGLVTHFVIAGQMNTGKTSTMAVLNKAIDYALSGTYRNANIKTRLTDDETTPLRYAKRRVIETRATSVQGLFDAVSQLGSCCWFADEAESQIQTMSTGDRHGDALKAFYKQTFDKSGALDAATLDVSRESTKLGVVPILNMNLPSYFSCTSEVFESLREKELVDGTYSRVNMIYDERPMDAVVNDEMGLHKGLPYGLMRLMQKIALIADDTAAAYDQPGLKTLQREIMNPKGEKTAEDLRTRIEANKRAGRAKTMIMQYSSGAAELKRRLTSICRQVGHEANPHVGKWPAHYQIMARTDILPVLIAGVLACLDMIAAWDIPEDLDDGRWRENMPQVVIGEHHLQWAFEFVMHWRLNFFKAWDQGKIAVQMSDDEQVALHQLTRLLMNPRRTIRAKGGVWMPYSDAVKEIKRRAPFKYADRAGAAQGRSGATLMVEATFKRLSSYGKVIFATGNELDLLSKTAPFISLTNEHL